MSSYITNPILSGFYPDPSICRVKDKFYLVNSSFSYFPGLPIFESEDLVHWEQIGNAIDRNTMLDFSGHGISRGLFAPTIRFNDGVFYIVCTLIDTGGNFLIYTKDINSSWSDPIYIKGANGIDPSLFFDDDGKCWYIGNRDAPEGPAYFGNCEAWAQELDISNIEKGKVELKGKSFGLWRGALKDCVWPEGPHVYKIKNWYYLIIAEGGTCLDHAVTVARSKSITGPWEGKRSNPILTHRHLGKTASIINVGHADLFDDTNGNYWMVCLGSRPYGKSNKYIEGDERCANMGRETFLVPVIFEDDWPVVSNTTGLIENKYLAPVFKSLKDKSKMKKKTSKNMKITFDKKQIDLALLMIRNPSTKLISLDEEKKVMCLYGGDSTRSKKNISYIGIRQTSFSFIFCASAQYFYQDNSVAGIMLFQNEDYQYRLELFVEGLHLSARVIKAEKKTDTIVAQTVFSTIVSQDTPISVKLIAECNFQNLSFSCVIEEKEKIVIADNLNARILSTEYAGGFVGTTIGAFATGNKKKLLEISSLEYNNLD